VRLVEQRAQGGLGVGGVAVEAKLELGVTQT
jgi:hypothetical protein